MKVTLKQIAEIAGVSRGTVDRAIHNRDGVNPQVRQRVLDVAESLGYTPNIAAKQLSARKLRLKIGIILPTNTTAFWHDVHDGVNRICSELSEYGVTVLIRSYQNYTAANQLQIIDELLEEGVSGLALTALNDPLIQKKINSLTAKKIPVVVLNSEIENTAPLCYIGCDYLLSGRTAAGLMHLLTGGKEINLLILGGAQDMMSHTLRITGFLQEMTRLNAPCHLLDICNIYDLGHGTFTEDDAYQITRTMLEKYPELNAIYTVAGSVSAPAKAIKDAGLAGKLAYIGFDLNKNTYPSLMDGSLTALIGQEAFRQGYQSIKILFDYLVNGIQPVSRRIILKNEIFIQQNADQGLPAATF